MKEFEAQEIIKMKEFEEREKQRVHDLELARLTGRTSDNRDVSDISRQVRFVPKFSGNDVTSFFTAFEKIAQNFNWPKEKWSFMVQTVLEGKALRVWSSLSVMDSSNYDKVKECILKAYELVPEAYRLKFRECRKVAGHTFLEFSRETERLFDEWLKSKEIEEFVGLKQLMLLENFKNNLSRDMKIYLEEQKVETLEQAARLADEFVLTHRNFGKQGTWHNKNSNESRGQSNAGLSNYDQTKNPKVSSGSGKRGITCYGCGEMGHVRSTCPKQKRCNSRPVSIISRSEKEVHPTGGVKDDELQIGTNEDDFKWFMSKGSVSAVGSPETIRDIVVLRDTGAAQSLILESALPTGCQFIEGELVVVRGFPDGWTTCPVVHIMLSSSIVNGHVKVAVVNEIPVKGVDLLLANDLARGKVGTDPLLVCRPGEGQILGNDRDSMVVSPVSVVTRSKSRGRFVEEDQLDLGPLFADSTSIAIGSDASSGRVAVNGSNNHEIASDKEDSFSVRNVEEPLDWSQARLIEGQKRDDKIKALRDSVECGNQWSDKFFLRDGVLFKRSIPIYQTAEESAKDQVVVPKEYREEILEKAHDSLFAGHAGISKTLSRVIKNFYWPGVKGEVAKYCKTCHECQLSGKPNQGIPKAPLSPIPSIGEPFEHVIIDIVGPLPKSSSGSEYLFTIIDRVSRYPEAIPIKSTKAPTIFKHLLNFFSRFGLPKTIQSDRGSNFLSHYFHKPFKLAVDASDLGVGAVLTQEDCDGVDHPVAYYSKKLNKHQKKYSVIEKEGLALILALQHFEVYLTSNVGPIVVHTDHNPIKFIKQFNNKNRRLTRWSLFLQDYNMEIHHIKGKDNVVPDILSRME